jgi:phage minor structural protein
LIKVYDPNMLLKAELENALNIGYEQKMNELWTASFSLPQDDPKNAECLPLRFVEIFDNGERVDLFRIIPVNTQRSGDGKTVSYQCEHALATLVDDVIFQYHRIDDTLTTRQALQYVLDFQNTERWQLGTVDLAHNYEYKWENVNLLGAIFSIPQPFIEDYRFSYDTTTTPWTLNLKELPLFGDPDCYIRYGKNLIGITKTEDPTYIVNRLYGLGYGEGVNQLTIAEVNANVPYIEDVASQALYGVIQDIFVDKRFESPETLKAQMQRALENSKLPKFTYTVDGADISSLTNDSIDKFTEGALVNVIDEELGIDIVSRVIKVSKSNITGEPWKASIQIANKLETFASSMAELRKRQLVSEVYSQGATNLDSHDFADNADATHPAVIRFYIPEETVRINKMILSYETSHFRAYERSIVAGGGNILTSAAGGASVETTQNGNGYLIGGDGSVVESGHLITGGLIIGGSMSGMILSGGVHNHGITTGTILDVSGGGTATFLQHGGHTHDMYSHSHYIDHLHDVAIPDHTHSVTLPDHVHGIEYGIFEYPDLPAEVVIAVDGNIVPITSTSGTNINIIPYLAAGVDGKVTRDAWHEIKITPNDLGRIRANVVSQIFIQSRGGGNF